MSNNAASNASHLQNVGAVAVSNHVVVADDYVREYLAFRGFSETMKLFEKERKVDRSKSMQCDKIVEQLFAFLKQYEILKCLEYWRYLEKKFFSQLDHNCYESVRKLEQSLKKYYVVNCVQTNRLDRCREFFEVFAAELIRDDEEWKDWFILPFIKLNELQNTKLEPYFNKHWIEMLYVSLYNFINTALMSAEKPMLLTIESEKRDRHAALKKKLNMLLHENESLKSKLMAAESYIAKLEKQVGINREQAINSSDQSALSDSDSLNEVTIEEGVTSSDDLSQQDVLFAQARQHNRKSIQKGATLDYSKLKTLQPKRAYNGHKKLITQCRFSSEGDYIATSSLDKSVRIWSLSGSCTIWDCSAPVLAIDWSKRNETVLVGGTSNGLVKLWNIETGKSVLSSLHNDPNNSARSICDIANCPSNGNYCIISALCSSFDSSSDNTSSGTSGELLGYSLKNMKIENKFPLDPNVTITHIVFNHNGSMVLTAGSDGCIRMYDVRSQALIMKWRAHNGSVTSVQFSRNETTILSTGVDNRIIHWSAHHEGRIIDEISPEFVTNNSSDATVMFNSEIIPRITLTSDGNELFMYNNPSVVYSMINKKPLFSLSSPLLSALDCHSQGHEEIYLAGADPVEYNLYLYSFIS